MIYANGVQRSWLITMKHLQTIQNVYIKHILHAIPNKIDNNIKYYYRRFQFY